MNSLVNRKALLLLLSKKNLGTENCVAVFVFTSIISLLEILHFRLERIITAKHTLQLSICNDRLVNYSLQIQTAAMLLQISSKREETPLTVRKQ